MADGLQDGIEVHFDDKTGSLELSCEPGTFRPYLEIARNQLRDFSEIHFDKVTEINVVDSIRYSQPPKMRISELVVVILVVVALVCAYIGFQTVLKWAGLPF